MSEHIISVRYAKAILKLALEKSLVSEARKDFSLFLKVLDKQRGFSLWLADDEVAHAKRCAVAREIASAIGINPLTSKFIEFLIQKNRIKHLKDITKVFNEKADEAEGVIRGHLFAAKKDAGDLVCKKIEEILSKKLKKSVMLDVKEDPSLLGGVFVQIKDYIWDASTKRKLEEMKENLCQ